MSTITLFLKFKDKAEEAANFYVSIFKNSKIMSITPGLDGKVMLVKFQLNGQEFTGLNCGTKYTFTRAISFVVNVDTQQEIDELWEKLGEGGEEGKYGWLRDQYGLSWQIIPSILEQWMSDDDPEKPQRVMAAVETMNKIDIETLRKAYEGEIQGG
ncbi:MAG: VOC family protein [Candidatus Omnitrophota bacterium]